MLVLTRHENEPTVLFRADGTIIGHVTPTLIGGGKVRLAFDFGPDVLIGRGHVPVMPAKGRRLPPIVRAGQAKG